MSESSAAAIDALQRWCEHLQAAADGEHNAVVDAVDQHQVEHAIAFGIALLANELTPEPAQELPTRPILARDLLITTDLVLRALQAHDVA